MNINHRLWMALVSEDAPEDVSKGEMVNYLASAADANWSYASAWYEDWLSKQESVGDISKWGHPPLRMQATNVAPSSDLNTSSHSSDCAVNNAPALEPAPCDCDPINPSHYQSESGVECIHGLQACSTDEEYKGHLRLTAIAYLWRLGRKDDALQDACKAKWYLDRLIAELELEKECE